MKIYSKEGKELKMGDWVVETVEKRTPTSKIVQKTKILLTPESIMDLIDAGMITLKDEKAENSNLTLDNVYTHIADKTGMPESEVVALLNNVHSIYPVAAVSIVLRALAEMLNCQVIWNEQTQGITIIDVDGTVITTKIGDNKIVTDGEMIEMDTTAKIINNRTYLPLRFVSEAFGFNVFWE